ncbi:MAG: Peptidyl-prolyl cis-trans isomerase [candidate division TM6 bacterium GW2011_GWF2_30_66]|nr:MAG: Peptidyl-prolyl cis-trans isomerase [candidate division TM6 bacterium GW2011_GWF2_30_66]
MANKSFSFSTFCMLGVLVFSLTGCGSNCSCGCCGDKCKDNVKSDVSNKQVNNCCNCCKCCSESKVSESKVIGDKKMIGTKQKSNSGLEWEVIKEGEGLTPKVGQTVVVHYTGWINENGMPGKKFDSSVDRGDKFEFTIGVGQVIAGWDEGVISMKKGEKRRIFIPSRLAYGSRGAGNIIKPNSDLIFDVELFDMY